MAQISLIIYTVVSQEQFVSANRRKDREFMLSGSNEQMVLNSFHIARGRWCYISVVLRDITGYLDFIYFNFQM